MKWLVTYACSVNGNPPHICNVVLPEELPPMNWIAIANREEKDDMANIEKRPVLREYSLINFWHVSDYDAAKWADNGYSCRFSELCHSKEEIKHLRERSLHSLQQRDKEK